MINERGQDAHDAVGKRAFEMEFGRIAAGILVADNDPRVRDASRAISRARAAADSGDFIAAIRLLGDVHMSVTPAQSPGLDVGVKPEDVEQALADLKRAIGQVRELAGTAQAIVLCKAARDAAINSHWEAAWALIDEADQRLAEARSPTRTA